MLLAHVLKSVAPEGGFHFWDSVGFLQVLFVSGIKGFCWIVRKNRKELSGCLSATHRVPPTAEVPAKLWEWLEAKRGPAKGQKCFCNPVTCKKVFSHFWHHLWHKYWQKCCTLIIVDCLFVHLLPFFVFFLKSIASSNVFLQSFFKGRCFPNRSFNVLSTAFLVTERPLGMTYI